MSKIIRLNSDLDLIMHTNFITKNTCECIMNAHTKAHFQRSRSIQHGKSSHLTSYSTKAYLQNEHTRFADRRMQAFAQTHESYVCKQKHPILLRYRQGQYATKHIDAFTRKEMKKFETSEVNSKTMILYLTDTSENTGGQLYFNNLDMMIYPKAGQLLVWNNLTKDFEVNYDSMHSSLPVKTGEKFALVKFFTSYID